MKKKRNPKEDRLRSGFPKICRIMRLICLFMFVSLLHVTASTYSQNNKLSLSLQNLTIEQVLGRIEDQSDYSFFYNVKEVDLSKVVDVTIKDQPIEKVLDQVMAGTGLTYTINNKLIIIHKSQNVSLSDFSNQQQKNLAVKGTVTDKSGKPVPGATIVVKGTTNGTITDSEGKFSLVKVPADAILEFSFVGMKTQSVPVNGKTIFTVAMTEETIGLDEVVAVGYGTQKKVNLTGAVATVDNSGLMKRPVTNPVSMLQGMMPGVQITQNTGEPGNEGTNIRIRGTGTFSGAGSDPLVLIDGVQGSLSDLDPNNIKNISVLKDAASASIYGARAANGVILVTTKTGSEGKLQIEYSTNVGFYKPTKLFHLVTNSAQYMQLWNEARMNSGYTSGLYTQDDIDTYQNATDRTLYPNTNWLDLIFRTAPTYTQHLNFTGGSNGTVYNVSLGYVDQTGTMKGFDYKKYNIRLNLTSELSDKFSFGINVELKKGEIGATVFGSQDLFLSAMSQAPTYGPVVPDGSGHYTYKAYDFEYNNKNPIAVIENNLDHNTDNYIANTQGWIKINLSKSLSWYTKGAFNAYFDKYKNFQPPLKEYNFRTGELATTLSFGTSLTDQDQYEFYYDFYSYLNYDRDFNGHHIKALLGYSAEKSTYQYLQASRQDLISDELRQLNAASPSVQYAYGTENGWALMSCFGRLDYDYHDRYLFEANLRYDGTSRLSSDSRWGVFPSFSAGWRISEEDFMKRLNLSWLDNLKIRGSWGQLGNQNIGNYPYQALLNFTGNYSFDDSNLSTGVAQQTMSNPNLKWEATTISDIGGDLTVLNGLNATIDWYKKRTTDILRQAQVTAVVGLGAPTINNGTMENKGVELGLTYNHQVRGGIFNGLHYSAGLNAEHYKNKLVKFGAPEIGDYTIEQEGHEWGSYYMLQSIGVFQSEDEIANSPKQFNDATLSGDLKYKDQNDDGKINENDRIIMPGAFPKLNYSFNLSADWKGFDCYVMFQGVDGVKRYVNGWGTIPFVQGAPPTTNWLNRWTETNH